MSCSSHLFKRNRDLNSIYNCSFIDICNVGHMLAAAPYLQCLTLSVMVLFCPPKLAYYWAYLIETSPVIEIK